MDCSNIRQLINDHRLKAKPLGDAVVEHIEICDLCRSLYEDAILSQMLRDLPIPPPRENFSDRAIKKAIKRNRTARVPQYIRIAAALLVIAVGTVLTWEVVDKENQKDIPQTVVATAPQTEKTVRIMIETREFRQNALFEIEMAENIHLKNHPGSRALSWQTDLTHGRNLLEIPLIIQDKENGYVSVRYRYNGKEKNLHIQVRADNHITSYLKKKITPAGKA